MAFNLPKDCFLWIGEDCVADGGSIIPDISVDVTQVNVATDLRGDFTGKSIQLILTDDSNPSRVFTSTRTNIGINGFYVGMFSFPFEKFHVNAGESYKITMCVNDDTGVSFGMIADWEPYANQHSKTQQVAGPRVELYGVESGLHAC